MTFIRFLPFTFFSSLRARCPNIINFHTLDHRRYRVSVFRVARWAEAQRYVSLLRGGGDQQSRPVQLHFPKQALQSSKTPSHVPLKTHRTAR
jgi:hypothetical protein